MNLEELRPGVSVISSDKHKLGTLSRFVLNKESLKLTHIVIDTGILRSGESLWKGGWGMSHDRIVPLGVLATADADHVRLTMSADEFKTLSVDYIDEYLELIPDLEPGRIDLSDLARLATSIPGEPGPYMMFETRAQAPGETEIKKDSPVWRLNPHEKIGEVDGLIFDEDTQKVTALVVRRGFLFTKEVVLPIADVVEVAADVVRIDMSDEQLHSLAEHVAE